jgi:hypothetical protein
MKVIIIAFFVGFVIGAVAILVLIGLSAHFEWKHNKSKSKNFI